MREPEPMQIGRTRLSPEERASHRQGNLCLYCGQAGHFVSRCPAKGTESSFLINEELALQLGITWIPLSKAMSASALDGHLLGTVTNQTEPIHMLLSGSSTPPDLTGVPTEYPDFSEVFNKAKATSLPPHKTDHMTAPSTSSPAPHPPEARLYSLSAPERKAMEVYINTPVHLICRRILAHTQLS
ncbi:hypothetical protein L3Q82_003781 [Scortum barcoo]|uniref:Uncharacterized protein n=1 Tax=Scortum barcoo TaxID=214431 RepID=A0ACB8X661_9TELE|nr:hypothetical protein L3Q82_003781 [Scortum barcoo]